MLDLFSVGRLVSYTVVPVSGSDRTADMYASRSVPSATDPQSVLSQQSCRAEVASSVQTLTADGFYLQFIFYRMINMLE